MTDPKMHRAVGLGPLSLVINTASKMDRPLTAKQEAFAVGVASGQDPAEAFLDQYQWRGKPSSVGTEAGRVSRHPRVAARIAELRNQYAHAAIEASRGKPRPGVARAYTVKDAMDDLDVVVAMALKMENPVALIKVVELRSKLFGLGIADAKNPGSRDELPPEELEAALQHLRGIRKARGGLKQ